jgi:large subunit ribosomal protein L21e
MTQKQGSTRRKTRSKLRKRVSERGKISIRNYLHKYKENDRVVLVAEPAVQKGMHHPRYQGKTGVVIGIQGNCYKVKIKDGNKDKIMITHSIHLRKE